LTFQSYWKEKEENEKDKETQKEEIEEGQGAKGVYESSTSYKQKYDFKTRQLEWRHIMRRSWRCTKMLKLSLWR